MNLESLTQKKMRELMERKNFHETKLALINVQLRALMDDMDEKEYLALFPVIEDSKWILADHSAKCVKCGTLTTWRFFNGTLGGSKNVARCKFACVEKGSVTFSLTRDFQALIDSIEEGEEN